MVFVSCEDLRSALYKLLPKITWKIPQIWGEWETSSRSPNSGSQPWQQIRISWGEPETKDSLGLVSTDSMPRFVEFGFIALHGCYIFTNWTQDLPPEKRLWRTLLRYSLYCRGLEPYWLDLWGMPVLVFCKSNSDALWGLRATRAGIGNWKPLDQIRPNPCLREVWLDHSHAHLCLWLLWATAAMLNTVAQTSVTGSLKYLPFGLCRKIWSTPNLENFLLSYPFVNFTGSTMMLIVAVSKKKKKKNSFLIFCKPIKLMGILRNWIYCR